MVETATKLPVRTERKAAPIAAPTPWAPFETLRREVDRLFEGMSGGGWPFAAGRNPLDLAWPRNAHWRVTPAVDVAESDKDFEITAELLRSRLERKLERKPVQSTASFKSRAPWAG